MGYVERIGTTGGESLNLLHIVVIKADACMNLFRSTNKPASGGHCPHGLIRSQRQFHNPYWKYNLRTVIPPPEVVKVVWRPLLHPNSIRRAYFFLFCAEPHFES